MNLYPILPSTPPAFMAVALKRFTAALFPDAVIGCGLTAAPELGLLAAPQFGLSRRVAFTTAANFVLTRQRLEGRAAHDTTARLFVAITPSGFKVASLRATLRRLQPIPGHVELIPANITRSVFTVARTVCRKTFSALNPSSHINILSREPEYVEIARRRIIGDAPLLNREAA